jgi:hypothetical protein
MDHHEIEVNEMHCYLIERWNEIIFTTRNVINCRTSIKWWITKYRTYCFLVELLQKLRARVATWITASTCCLTFTSSLTPPRPPLPPLPHIILSAGCFLLRLSSKLGKIVVMQRSFGAQIQTPRKRRFPLQMRQIHNTQARLCCL